MPYQDNPIQRQANALRTSPWVMADRQFYMEPTLPSHQDMSPISNYYGGQDSFEDHQRKIAQMLMQIYARPEGSSGQRDALANVIARPYSRIR